MQSLYTLPKDLLIKIICEQNLPDHYKKIKECDDQIKKIQQRREELSEEHKKNIGKIIFDKMPIQISRDDSIYKKDERDEIISTFINKHSRILITYHCGYWQIRIEFVIYPSEIILYYQGTKTKEEFYNLFPELVALYDYLHSTEFIKLLFSSF